MPSLDLLLVYFVSFATCYQTDNSLSLAAYKEGVLNEACRSNYDCGTYGYYCAANRTCQCLDQYLADNERKACRGGVDQRCQYDEHCIDGAYCLNQANCQCKETRPLSTYNGMRCSGSALPSASVALIFFFIVLNT